MWRVNQVFTQRTRINTATTSYRHESPVFDVEEDSQLIKSYLNKIQQWGHFELSVFSNCLSIFPTDYIKGTYKTLCKRTKILSQIDTYQNDLAIFLNNCIILLFERQYYSNLKFYCSQLYQLSEHSSRKVYDRLMSNFYNELLKECLGLHAQPERYIQTFQGLGFSEHAASLQEFRKQIL